MFGQCDAGSEGHIDYPLVDFVGLNSVELAGAVSPNAMTRVSRDPSCSYRMLSSLSYLKRGALSGTQTSLAILRNANIRIVR